MWGFLRLERQTLIECGNTFGFDLVALFLGSLPACLMAPRISTVQAKPKAPWRSCRPHALRHMALKVAIVSTQSCLRAVTDERRLGKFQAALTCAQTLNRPAPSPQKTPVDVMVYREYLFYQRTLL